LSDILLRKCEREDLAQVCAIENASFSDPYSRLFFEWLRFNTGEGFKVAIKEGRIVGYVIVGVTHAAKGHLASIATDPRFRRTGIGTLLMDSVLAYLSERHVGVVSLEVRPSNAPAVAFYRKFSFVESGRKRRYYPDGEDALVMTKRLSPD